jgi:hypothetical protein
MKAFVLMPFAKPINDYYQRIFRPALEAAGYSVSRADDLFAPRPIILDIQESIGQADLILCEMTDKNPNVFYELGLAHALGKPAILLSQRQGDIPFDLRHIRVILYDPAEVGWDESLRELIIAAARACRTSQNQWPPALVARDSSSNDRSYSAQESRTTDVKPDERVLFRLRPNGRFDSPPHSTSGPYPYRFTVEGSYKCELVLDLHIWAVQNKYENVVTVIFDEKEITTIRQAYVKRQTTKIDLGLVNWGRHTIAFKSHYEDLSGRIVTNEYGSGSDHYWVLYKMDVTGRVAPSG